MNGKFLLLSVASLATLKSYGQVQDVSFTITPMAGYNWFDKKTTVEDGFMYGLQAGFGFGRVIELTGTFEQSAELKQRFGDYEDDISDYIPGFEFQNRNVKVTRIGGQIKANIPAQGFAPYILIGTGVQTYERAYNSDVSYKNENLYGMAGLGFKINLGARATLNLEGKGLVHNMRASSLLYNPNATSDFDEWINNQDRNRIFNWGVNAGLQFYLGGNNYGNMTALDREYYRAFSSGMTGAKFTIAPVGGYVNFNNEAAYKNAYFLGGELGVDFSDYVGLKAYYMHAVDKHHEDFAFDYLGMYGVDFVGKLNVSRGIVPYLTVGGGYLNVMDEYDGKNRGTSFIPVYQAASSSYYAKGGVGIEIPVSKHVDLFGSANVFYTINNTETEVTELVNTKQLYQNTMYTAGLKFKLGRSADIEGARQDAFNSQFSDERASYNRKIKSLEKELLDAYNSNDTARVREIMIEKNEVEKSKNSNNLIRLTPQELESLIDKVIDGVENESTPNIENRLDRLEELLINFNQSGAATSTTIINDRVVLSDNNDYRAINDRLINEINLLKQQINDQNNQINNLQIRQNNQPVVTTPQVVAPQPIVTGPAVVTTPNNVINNRSTVEGVVLNHGMSLFGGVNFGDATTFNIGIRGNWGFTNNPIVFMPELYVGLGDRNGFGVSANAIYPIRIQNTNFTPYAGLGLGFNVIGSETTFNPNFIGGVSYALTQGSLFADYTVRGAFRNNQIALGYRFRF